MRTSGTGAIALAYELSYSFQILILLLLYFLEAGIPVLLLSRQGQEGDECKFPPVFFMSSEAKFKKEF